MLGIRHTYSCTCWKQLILLTALQYYGKLERHFAYDRERQQLDPAMQSEIVWLEVWRRHYSVILLLGKHSPCAKVDQENLHILVELFVKYNTECQECTFQNNRTQLFRRR